MRIGIEGRFVFHKQKVKMENGLPVLDDNGHQILIGDKEKSADFHNLITNTGLDGIGTGKQATRFYLSTDTAEPSINDNLVIGQLGVTTSTVSSGYGASSTSQAPYFNSYFITKRFIAGVGTGNITKVYTGWADDGIWSTALIKDAIGNPTTITKLIDEVLDVTYEVRHYIPSNPVETIVDISGVKYSVLAMVSKLRSNWITGGLMPVINPQTRYVGAFTQFGSIEQDPSWTFVDTPVLSKGSYVAGSYELSCTLSAGVDKGNFANGIQGIYLSNEYGYFAWKFEIKKVSNGTPLIKTADFTLTLPPITISWGRYVVP